MIYIIINIMSLSPIEVHIYLLCNNESILIGPTIDHYQKQFRSIHNKITILDNESTDNSAEIALSKGCEVRPFSTDGKFDDYKNAELKNQIWKEFSDQDQESNLWIIVADMDEWLSISDEELSYENAKGTTILTTIGYNITGNSQQTDLSDIDVHSLVQGFYWPNESKSLCFKRSEIQEMNYELGAHTCNPIGRVQYSDQTYVVKHMEVLGLPFMIAKFQSRYKRTEKKRLEGEWWAGLHYTDNVHEITERYREHYDGAIPIGHLLHTKLYKKPSILLENDIDHANGYIEIENSH